MRHTSRQRRMLVLAGILTTLIFLLDVALPLGVTVGTLYVFVILLGLWIREDWYPPAATIVAIVLLGIDTAINWTEVPPATIFFNRPLLTMVFVVTGLFVRRHSRVEQEAASRLRQLADLKYALDQSAIVATTDVRGRITYVNDKFCEISKYSAAELIGQDHRIVNSGAHSKELFNGLWRTIAQGRVWHGEIRNRAKDGTLYWVDTTIVPFVDDHGHPYQYTAIRSDITARKHMEGRLREQAALARLGQMAAVVAHEVRNPLAGIKGAMQVLAARRPEGDPESAVMTDIVARVDSLNDLIDDLLVFARPAAPRYERVDLAAVLQRAVDFVRSDPAGRQVDMRLESAPIEIDADPALLQALFLNLLINSAQATQGRGRVDIRAHIDSQRAVVSVRDFGPGIPDDVAAQMFEPFFTTKTRGGGLGLAIARRTAELHEGSLRHVRPEGGGAEMVVTLALKPLPSADSTPEADAAG